MHRTRIMIPVVVLSVGLLMFVVERLRPGVPLSAVSGWWSRTLLLHGVQGAMVWVGGMLWEPWIASHRVLDASALGVAGGVLVGYVAITFVYYWWHRARHEVESLWRLFHQVHHSPSRLEVFTSFYKHPLEMATNSVLSAAVLYLLVGLTPEVASGVVLVTGVAELFYHWNVSTPRWLGYLVQRPEMHRVHHARGHHTHNFSDLPLWDMLFGTFNNPARFDGDCGFAPDRELLLGPMLRGEDVHRSSVGKPKPRLAWLLLLGGAAILGDVSGGPVVQGLAMATGASPAPKVFTTRRGYEPFSSRFEVRWRDAEGNLRRMALAPDGARLRGPYNRRNVYGAMIAGAPLMEDDPSLEPMFREVSRFAFCGERPLFQELGIAPQTVRDPVQIVGYPRAGPSGERPAARVITVQCGGEA